MERLILNNKDNLKKPLVELEILEANLKDLEKIREKTKRYQKRFVFLI
jgi:hypothetical protein